MNKRNEIICDKSVNMIILMVSFLVFVTKTWAQDKNPSLSIHQNDVKVVFHYSDDQVNPNKKVTYYWMKYRVVHFTRGGYDGQLLDGEYREFFISGQLKSFGTFKKGIKTGEWISWYENGEKEQISNFKKGIQDGRFSLYYNNGKIQEQGNYAHGEKNGKVFQFTKTGEKRTVRYRHGKRVDKAAKKTFRENKKIKKQKKKMKKKQPKISIIDPVADEKTNETKRRKTKKVKGTKSEAMNSGESKSFWSNLKKWLKTIFSKKSEDNEKD